LAGIYVDDHKLPATTTQAELLALIEKKNADPKIHGILVQLPLPKQIDSRVILEAVSPDKDADGFHPYNFGRLVEGHPVFEACTPKGVIKMIESAGVAIEGKRAVVLGRSNIVGKPLALMLLQRHATVTICHSKTRNLADVVRQADVIVAAIGRTALVTRDMVKPGAVVMDVGTNKVSDRATVERLFGKDPARWADYEKRGYVWAGDVDELGVKEVASMITPVPGGVGPMTIATLMKNTIAAAKMRRGI